MKGVRFRVYILCQGWFRTKGRFGAFLARKFSRLLQGKIPRPKLVFEERPEKSLESLRCRADEPRTISVAPLTEGEISKIALIDSIGLKIF